MKQRSFLCSFLFFLFFFLLLSLLKILLTLHKPRYRVQRNLPLISLLRAYSLVRIPRMRRQEVFSARHLPFALPPLAYLHLLFLRVRHDVSDRFFPHSQRPQQLLQRRILHIHERTSMTLLPSRPGLHHHRARQRVQRHAPALQSVQIPNIIRVLPRELLHRQLRRELLLEERQRALHAQPDAAEEPAQLLASVVEEMMRLAEMQVHRLHAQRERPIR